MHNAQYLEGVCNHHYEMCVRRMSFTLQHVAAGVQVNPATLSRIERLEQIPSIELAERLANFFKGEVSEMQILYPARFQSSQNQNGFKPQEQEVNRG